jgi:hypothetical protein
MSNSTPDNKGTSKSGLIKAIARWPWPELVFFAACIVSTFTIVSSISGDYFAVKRQGQLNNSAVEDHEARIRAIETQLTRIDTNVEWIRSTLESRTNHP